MSSAVAGRVRGAVIELDRALPALEGRRVRVLVEPEDDAVLEALASAPIDDLPATPQEQSRLAAESSPAPSPSAAVRARVLGRT